MDEKLIMMFVSLGDGDPGGCLAFDFHYKFGKVYFESNRSLVRTSQYKKYTSREIYFVWSKFLGRKLCRIPSFPPNGQHPEIH